MDHVATRHVTPPPRLWLRAVRPFSLTASAVPVLLGAAVGLTSSDPVAWALLPAVVLAALAVHAGTNLFNDTHDYRRGVDRAGTLGGSGLLVAGTMTPRQTQRAALLCFALAVGLGAWFVALRGWLVAAVGGAGLIGGYGYTGRPLGYKYRALGDVFVLLLMGPLMVVGADLVLTGHIHLTAVWVGLPMGLLVMSILHGNNLRDLADDEQSGFRTVAMMLGAKASRWWYAAMVLGAFGAVGLFVGIGLLPLWSVAIVAALPLAIRNARRVLRSDGHGDALTNIDVRSAQTHAAFGVLLCGSLIAAAVL